MWTGSKNALCRDREQLGVFHYNANSAARKENGWLTHWQRLRSRRVAGFWDRYLPGVVDDEDAACRARSWMRPIPRPPTAPARTPRTSSIITFSRIDFFFVTVFPFWMLVITYLSIPDATSNLRFWLQVTEVAWDGGARAGDDVKGFSAFCRR